MESSVYRPDLGMINNSIITTMEKAGVYKGIPHYKVNVGKSYQSAQTLISLAEKETEKVVNELDFSESKKITVAFWTHGMPELIYISTFEQQPDGSIVETKDMSSSTI